MTPKEKAIELLDKMSSQTYSYQPYAGAHYLVEEIGWEAGKKCALIAIDEIYSNCADSSKNDYWIEVKNELDNL
jgi:hypothetical protein